MLKEAEAQAPEEVASEYTDFEKGRFQEYEEKEKKFTDEKALWKKDNPTDTIKRHKEWYIKGIIDTLSWENYKPIHEESPLPLDQWNQNDLEAEKEVSMKRPKKNQRKKKTSHNEGSENPNQNKVQASRIKSDPQLSILLNFELKITKIMSQNEEQNNNSVWKNIKKIIK